MTFHGRHIGTMLATVARKSIDDNLLGWAAETAYNFFFGIFPAVLFAAPLLALFADPNTVLSWVLTRASESLPPDAALLVERVVKDILTTSNAPGLISAGVVLSLWAGSSMFSSLMSALNAAYEVKETRPWWKQKLIAMACTIGGVFAVWCATIIMLAGQQIVDAAVRFLGLSAAGAVIWAIVQYLLALALVVAFLWTIYVVLPNVHKQHKQTVIAGGLFATLFWLLFTYAFRMYVEHFGSYNKTYGTIGAVIVLLTWMYWTMFAILVGGEVNAELQRAKDGGPPPTPRGGA